MSFKSDSQNLIEKIHQENRQIAEIEKVARYDGKQMFWQWVNAGKWFLGGAVVAVLLRFVMQRVVNPGSLEVNWFNYPLFHADIQDFLNANFFKNSFIGNLFILILLFPLVFWIKYYYKQISVNFLQINFTKKLIIAGYGFFVGLEALDFGFAADKFVFWTPWAGNENWVWKVFGITIWDFSNPINFYFFKDFRSLNWSDVYFSLRLLVFVFLSVRLVKVLFDFWKGKLLQFNFLNKKVVLANKQRNLLQKIYVCAFF